MELNLLEKGHGQEQCRPAEEGSRWGDGISSCLLGSPERLCTSGQPGSGRSEPCVSGVGGGTRHLTEILRVHLVFQCPDLWKGHRAGKFKLTSPRYFRVATGVDHGDLLISQLSLWPVNCAGSLVHVGPSGYTWMWVGVCLRGEPRREGMALLRDSDGPRGKPFSVNPAVWTLLCLEPREIGLVCWKS